MATGPVSGSQQQAVKAYILHDPVANMEGYITDYDQDALKQAEDSGMIIIAEMADGSRRIASADEVKKPTPLSPEGIELATPAYVDERVSAMLDVISSMCDGLGGVSSLSGARKLFSGGEIKDKIESLKSKLGGDGSGSEEDAK